MIETIEGMPDGVLGFRGNGKIESSDYRDVLIPAVESVLASGNDVRVVLVFEDWDGITAGAMWQDMKMGADHLRKWRKIALVTDVDWMRHATNVFGWMMPGDVKVFTVAELDAAKTWAAAD